MIGFPALACTAMEQGRLAACSRVRAAGQQRAGAVPVRDLHHPRDLDGGRTEEELTKEGVPYEVGKASYKEIAAGPDHRRQDGVAQADLPSDTDQLLGVHIIGEGASELVHIGQAVMTFGGTRRVLRQHGVQLPDAGRVLQGGGLRRPEPDSGELATWGKLRKILWGFLILVPFAFAQFRRLGTHSRPNLLPNAAGSVILCAIVLGDSGRASRCLRESWRWCRCEA